MICIGFISGLWIIGRVEGTVMYNPRLYLFSKNEHGIMNMPCDPPALQTDKFNLLYGANGDIVDLYNQQVDKSVLVKPSTNVRVFDERGNIKLS